jgi:O-antigen/teichoic acid export membrane protein
VPTAEPDVLDNASAGGRVIRGGAMRTVAYGVSLLLGLVSVPLMTRHLGVVDYGYYITVASIVFIIGGFTEAGLTSLGIREYSSLGAEDRTSYMRAIAGLRVVLTTVGVVAATLFAWLTDQPSVVVSGTLVAGVGLLLGLVQQTYAIPLAATLRFGWISVIDVLRQTVLVAFIVGCVIAGTGLFPFFFAQIASGTVTLLATVFLLRADVPSLLPAVDAQQWRRMVREILPYALGAVAGVIYFRLGVILLGYVASDEEVGIYSTSFRIVEVVSTLPFVAVSTAFPILARAASNDADRLRYVVQRLFDSSILLGTLLVLCLVAGARFAIAAIAPIDAFGDAVPVLRLQALAVVFTFLVAAFSFVLLSLKRYRAVLWSNLAALVVASAGTPLLAPTMGAEGAALATTAAEAVLAIAYLLALRRTDPSLVPRFEAVPRVAVAAAFGACAVLLRLPAVLEAALASAAYLSACLVLGVVPREFREALFRRRRG